jgi:hypothetical protein
MHSCSVFSLLAFASCWRSYEFKNLIQEEVCRGVQAQKSEHGDSEARRQDYAEGGKCQQSVVCSVGLEALTLDLNEQDLKSNGTLKEMNTVEESYESTGQPSHVTTTSKTSIGKTCQQLILCAEGSPVNRLVLPGSDEAKRMTVTSGRKLCAAYEQSSQLGSLARMCLDSSTWVSSKCWLTWRALVITPTHSLFQLVPSMLHTEETEFGLWLTPTAVERWATDETEIVTTSNGTPRRKYKNGKTSSLGLTQQVAWMWPTPASQSGGGCHGLGGGSGNTKKLRGMVGEEVGKQMASGSLNPNWVEWLMGYPIGWTDLELSVTPSSRKSRKR